MKDGDTLSVSMAARKYLSLMLLVIFFINYGTQYGLAQDRPKKSVLVLNSYHKGYKWSDSTIEGIASVLGPNARNIELVVEDMDTYRIQDNGYIHQLYETYRYKFHEKKFDVIIAADDPAFSFLLRYHEELFPGTPVVFCGVNYFEDAMLTNQELFTGVVEGQDIQSTLQLALKLHPGTKNIYVVNDNTITGKAIEKTLQDAVPLFSDKVNFISLRGYNMEQIKETLAHAPPESLILFLILFQDATGQTFSYSESISAIAASSSIPIYGVWDFSLGYGLVGGMLTSGYYQGELAAMLAQRILNGEKPAAIPVVKNSPNHYMFDSSQMKRFNIQNAELPPDSIIINDTYSGKKQVLILNSYDHGMPWAESIISGIKSVLHASETIDLHYEFMDTKHNTGPEYMRKVYDLYRYKFSSKHFDAIITSDDDAYNFLLKYNWEIFPNVPVIFCGINYFQDSDVTDNPLFTGVVESIDIQKTIEIALNLHPATKKIVIINDKTATGEANKKLLQEVLPKFPAIDFTFFEDMNMSEVQNRVESLPADSIILLMSFNKDKSNNIYSYEESIRIISEKAAVPIYSVWDFYLGHGIVGGMLTSGYYQGKTAADLLLRILNGEQPRDIPIIKQSPNKYMFDYNYLAKHRIDPAKLPQDSIVINEPASNFEKFGLLLFSIVFVIVCTILIIQRKKAQDQLKILAKTDALTGILNRGAGLAILKQHMDVACQYNHKLTIAFIDVNNLKVVNDTYGHHEGDQLIKTASLLLKQKLRQSDTVCRLGGDEFLLIFPDCDLAQAIDVWNRIEGSIDAYNSTSQKSYNLSLSHGFAEYNPAIPTSSEELIKAADNEMYARKRLYKANCEE